MSNFELDEKGIEKPKPEQLKEYDDSDIFVRCRSCDKTLLQLMGVVGKTLDTKISADCPFCGDCSFPTDTPSSFGLNIPKGIECADLKRNGNRWSFHMVCTKE